MGCFANAGCMSAGHIWVFTTVAENIDLNVREKPIIKFLNVLKDAHSARGTEEPVRGIVATPSGKLFSVGYDRSLCIWDTDHLAQVRRALRRFAPP